MYSSSQNATMTSKSNSSFDELRWVIQIRQTVDEELEDDTGVPVSIFNVPKTLSASKPHCYIPQEVAIGPFHYWRPELYEMERYKIAAAKKTQKQLKTLKFENLVDQLMKHEQRIRACFHRYLDFNGETLAWMVAVDACFLLEFLYVYAIKEGKVLKPTILSTMLHLVDYAGTKSAHNALLRDIAMLENQIPLFILRKILEVQNSSLDAADDLLHSMLLGLCKELSPFKMIESFPSIQVSDCAHLLDCLYQIVVPKSKQQQFEITEACEDQIDQNDPTKEGDKKEEKLKDSSDVKNLFNELWKLLSKLHGAPVRFIKSILFSRPVKLLFKLPWTIITRFPLFSILKKPMEYLFFNEDKEDIKPENGTSNSVDDNKPPLLEEITIPSVSELYESGIRFVATKGDITTVSFDAITFTFYLPSVSLDVNTEVVLRNLVAYEASDASGPLIFTRYVELMNGIIDTEEDVKLLREKGIVLNHLKSDKEVADLWNGMSMSVRLTKVPLLDKVIEDVNKYYSGTWKVKAKKILKSYVFGSWKFLSFLAAILFLFLMIVQSFCSVYSCAHVLHIKTTSG
ncbi:putative UPF0481 protein At3g02645 [Macadamia integrifolia]|uniref:putative UPF0481 protein At3g02645 n=1 Tax=Macadamia integrifolia TaxID=60698 RepID=UPI001C4F69A5|nr:putative UPF0481 protein At3g02645 [Macadamia integrifolia]